MTGSLSLPPRGAWIEILVKSSDYAKLTGRSPHGERGLKYCGSVYCCAFSRRSPHGERGLKSEFWTLTLHRPGRSPHGERGLKSRCLDRHRLGQLSLPPRGAWIEISTSWTARSTAWASLPPRGAWIEITRPERSPRTSWSRSPHGERGLKWKRAEEDRPYYAVAPSTGSVD